MFQFKAQYDKTPSSKSLIHPPAIVPISLSLLAIQRILNQTLLCSNVEICYAYCMCIYVCLYHIGKLSPHPHGRDVSVGRGRQV